MAEQAELTLRERVARKLCDLYGTLPPDTEDHVRCGGKPAWTAHEADAIKLLKAIREPTEAMVKAGEAEIYEHHAGAADWTLESTRNGWRAMVDSELTGQ